jgi:hypothetical protein
MSPEIRAPTLWGIVFGLVANTRWWPPFCLVVDWVVTAVIAGEIAAGMEFGWH